MGSQGEFSPLNLSRALPRQTHCSPSQQSPKGLGWSIANSPAHGSSQTKRLRSKCGIPKLCPDVSVCAGRGGLLPLCLRSCGVPAVNQVNIYHPLFSILFIWLLKLSISRVTLFNWSTVDLWVSVSFRRSAKWFRFMYVFFFRFFPLLVNKILNIIPCAKSRSLLVLSFFFFPHLFLSFAGVYWPQRVGSVF